MFGARATAGSLFCALSALAFFLPIAESPAAEDAVASPPAEVAPPSVPPPPLKSYGPFALDPRLEPRVKFWVDIYARYHSWETLIVDIRYPQLIFSRVDTRAQPGLVPSERRKISALLKRVGSRWAEVQAGKLKRGLLKPDELRIVEMYEKEGLIELLPSIASDPKLLRTQAGLRDALEDALFVSGRYLPRMKDLFQRLGLPEEIAYLPFVESGFNKRAVSKVGASGIWQFMPYTGKLFLRVDDVVDERNDPMRAAEAAARLMKQNHDMLGDWALAITAYNHGTAGVARAARETGTRQIAEIIAKVDTTDNKNFGFASKNFYACFLAALHVAKNSDTYLGAIPRAKRLEFDEFVMPDFMAVGDFLQKMQIDETLFRELNPALTEEVYAGRKYIPVGYTVRVPIEAREDFLARYEAIPAAHKFRAQRTADQDVTRVLASDDPAVKAEHESLTGSPQAAPDTP